MARATLARSNAGNGPGSDLPGVRASCPRPLSGCGTPGLSAGATPAESSSKTHRFLTVKVTADGYGTHYVETRRASPSLSHRVRAKSSTMAPGRRTLRVERPP